MRKLGVVLSLLGGFLVVLALLARFYAAGQLMKTPLDVNTTTYLAGEAKLGNDPAFPVKAVSITRADSAKSTGDVVVFANSSCLVKDVGNVPNCVSAKDPQKRLISASVDNFATDRVTAVAVNDPSLLPPDAQEHKGLVNKWPFESKKQDYQYWNDTTGSTQTAQYVGEKSVMGLTVYVYRVQVQDFPTELADGVHGTYSTDTTIYVEPLTGAIVNQVEHQERLTDAGDNFLTLDLAFTANQVKTSVDDAKSNVLQLNLVKNWVFIVGLVLGIPALVVGTLMTVRGRRSDDPEYAPAAMERSA